MGRNKAIVPAARIAAAASPGVGLWGSRAPSPRPAKVPDPERMAKAQAKRDRKNAKRATKEASNAG
jgi:hypothetical protein